MKTLGISGIGTFPCVLFQVDFNKQAARLQIGICVFS